MWKRRVGTPPCFHAACSTRPPPPHPMLERERSREEPRALRCTFQHWMGGRGPKQSLRHQFKTEFAAMSQHWMGGGGSEGVHRQSRTKARPGRTLQRHIEDTFCSTFFIFFRSLSGHKHKSDPKSYGKITYPWDLSIPGITFSLTQPHTTGLRRTRSKQFKWSL